jgi:hypothetical protein
VPELHAKDLEQTLERAYVLAISKRPLPKTWLTRAENLNESPSVAFVAAVGSVLLARATDPSIDAFVIQAKEGGPGAFNLRAPATVLARGRRRMGYDIGSTSDRDPINHGTLIGSQRWDVALDRITARHKPFFQLILRWLVDINKMNQKQALEALAAYIRVRRAVAPGAAATKVPTKMQKAPPLSALIDATDAFVGAATERGARGMALVAAAYRAAGFDAKLPARNDPRRIDIHIERNGIPLMGSEVKQEDTVEDTADTLAEDASQEGISRAVLAVMRPGKLVSFDRTAVIRRAETQHGVILRVVHGSRELLHEALSASDVAVADFCSTLPRHLAEALRDIRVEDETVETWAAIATQWQ